jgi:hypothetical protein
MKNKEREKKIKKIQAILTEWGSTTSTELQLDHSPCIATKGNGKLNVSILVEGFTPTDVNVITYNGETVIDDSHTEYDDLNDEIIDEIAEIMESYDVDMTKTMEKSRSNNY